MPAKKKPAGKKSAAKKPAGKQSAAQTSAAHNSRGGVCQLKVTLSNFRPKIWRRLLLPADCTLGDLHVVLQIAMGWGDSHMHQFVVDGTNYAASEFQLEETRDEDDLRLADIACKAKTRLRYDYDFGDNWEHEILVEKLLDQELGATCPVCVAGEGAGPPEDVGGVWGYTDMLEAIADKSHPRHDEFMEWVAPDYDPTAFDLDAVNHKLAKLG